MKRDRVAIKRKDQEIFITVEGIGLTCLVNEGLKFNFISPSFVSFFNVWDMDEAAKASYSEVFSPKCLESVFSMKDLFQYVGKSVAKCRDNRLSVCKCYKLKFVYEAKEYSLPFLLDKALKCPIVLGRSSREYCLEVP